MDVSPGRGAAPLGGRGGIGRDSAGGRGGSPRRADGVAAAWGFAEATLFFLVPDIWLTAIALRGVRRAVVACGWALAGALAGGLAMYLWGAARPEAVASALDAIPAISPGMLDRVGAQLAEHGAAATLLGPPAGTPYKTYAALAPSAGVGLLPFLLASVPARLGRFLLLAAGVGWLAPRLLPRTPVGVRLAVLLAVWAAFYLWYFASMPG